MKIPTIPHDKLLHYLVGQLIALLSVGLSPWLSLLLVAAAAIGKEAYDSAHPATHTCDPWDAAATVIGGVLVWVGYLLGVVAR